jgi:hypothetical protein
MKFLYCQGAIERQIGLSCRISHNSLYDSCYGPCLAGLTKSTCDMRGFHHVTAMADYALRIREQLSYVNEHSFNNFRIRIGGTLAFNL